MNKHILKLTHNEAFVKCYTTLSAGEDINISLQNDLTLPTEVYVPGSADIDEATTGSFANFSGSHVFITGIWWGAKDGKRVDVTRVVSEGVHHNHYYLIGAGHYNFKQEGVADRIYAHSDLRVSFIGGEGHCILRLSKMGWNSKIELPQFSVYDDPNAVGS